MRLARGLHASVCVLAHGRACGCACMAGSCTARRCRAALLLFYDTTAKAATTHFTRITHARITHNHTCLRFLYDAFVVAPGPRRCAGCFGVFTDASKAAFGERRFNKLTSNGVGGRGARACGGLSFCGSVVVVGVVAVVVMSVCCYLPPSSPNPIPNPIPPNPTQI